MVQKFQVEPQYHKAIRTLYGTLNDLNMSTQTQYSCTFYFCPLPLSLPKQPITIIAIYQQYNALNIKWWWKPRLDLLYLQMRTQYPKKVSTLWLPTSRLHLEIDRNGYVKIQRIQKEAKTKLEIYFFFPFISIRELCSL